MPATDEKPQESEAIRHLRARLTGRQERLKHLETNHPQAAEAIANVKAAIADLNAQLSAVTK